VWLNSFKKVVLLKIVSEEKDFVEALWEKGDLGLANLLVEKLLESEGVSFAACGVDHPLKGNVVIRVKAKDPKKEIKKALAKAEEDLKDFQQALEKAK
jgi:DNA-directed RNA polymerase subunit L